MRLKLSKRGDYVVRSAIALAHSYDAPSPKKLRQISLEMGVPRTFVSQILGDLVQAGIATSFFGANGGYRLTRSPGEITLLEIVEAGEGPLEPDTCVLGDEPCHWESVCPVHETWASATGALRAELSGTSLATLVERDRLIAAGDYHVIGHRRGGASVEVTDAIQVERPLEGVLAHLARAEEWLAPHVAAAGEESEELLVKVGPGAPGWLAKTVRVHLGELQRAPSSTVIPLAWEATGSSGFFPRLDGQLRVRALDEQRTEVGFVGHYQPPLGRAGAALDDVLLARVARATIRSLLRRIARALED